MEDKNQQPLVPDMLYRHTPEQPELPPEALPLEAALFADAPVPECAAPSADAESVTLPAMEQPELCDPAAVAPLPFDLPAEEDFMAAAVPEDTLLFAPPTEEDPLAAFIPAEEIAFTETPVSPSPDETVSSILQGGEQTTSIDDTIAWITEEGLLADDGYDTFEPEEPELPPAEILPEPQKPEFTDMRIEKSREKKPAPAKKNTAPAVKKGRPKRKKGVGFLGIPHLIAALIWLGIIVVIGSSLGKLLWVAAADVLAFGRENQEVTVVIVDSDTIDTIAAKLEEAGLVKYPELFKFYAKLTGDDEEITTGSFTLNTNLDYHALTNALSPSSSNRAVVKVTIPEGYSCRQIFQLLAASNVCSVEALEEYAAGGELPEYWFLENVARGDRYCLEGFLFPDTYEFYANSTPKEALSKMLSGFNVRFTEEMQAQLDALNQQLSDLMRANGKSEEYIAANQLTVREVMIIASLVEKETAGSGESATIASVIYNRLYNWGDEPAYLGIDATIYYALDGNIDPETGNTKELTSEDLKIDSPFNTRTHVGLTPTPIANPGLTSIQAALNPQNTGYYYYVLNPETNQHQFSKTREEHEKWVQQFYHSED